VATDSRRMATTPTDPDLDLGPQARRRIERIDDRIEHFQRLVVNPFLAVSWILGSLSVVFWMMDNDAWIAIMIAVGSVPVPFRLLQFHCRDCGHTGMYRDWPRHECEAVVLRRIDGTRRRWGGPSSGFQLRLWGLLLGAVALIELILYQGRMR
jgi:hypothetical protein